MFNISEITLLFEAIEEAMNLPSDVRIVSISEMDRSNTVKIKIASARQAPKSFASDKLSNIGEAYLHPENHS